MPWFGVSEKDGRQGVVRARNVEHAAGIAGRRFYGPTTLVQRVTGEKGKSGIFAAFKWDKRVNASNRIGSDFHVSS